MSTPLKPPTGNDSNFVAHPAGSFMAVCADVYVKKEKNHFFGKPKDKNDPSKGLDTKEYVDKAYILFLTGLKKEDGSGDLSASVQENFLWGGTDKPSNLFKIIKGWYPTATAEQVRDMDLNNLVGQTGYVTVTHNDNGYAKITGVSQPPPGAVAPQIPADFKRREDRQPEPVAQAAPVANVNPNPLPHNPGMNAVHQGIPNTNQNLPASNPFRDIPNGDQGAVQKTERAPF